MKRPVVALTCLVAAALPHAGCSSGPDAAGADRLIETARQHASRGRPQEALADLDRAIAADPRRAEPHLRKAQVLDHVSRHREAFGEALAAHRLEPKNPETALTALRMGAEYSSPAESESLARAAIAAAPGEADGYLLLGDSIVRAGDPKRQPEAVTAYKEANRLAPESAAPLIALGKQYARMNDRVSSEAMFTHAARLLDLIGQRPAMPVEIQAQWMEERRASAFGLWQLYLRTGRKREAENEGKTVATWSRSASKLRALRNRASATPPDSNAQALLTQIGAQGLSYWTMN